LRKPWLWLVVGVAAGVLVQSTVHGARNLSVVSPDLLAVVEKNAPPAQAMSIEPSWILEGQPKFFANAYFETPQGETISGIWVCEGPAKFRWRNYLDEGLHVLEGSAEIEHEGVKRTLHPGDTAIFKAGTWTNWHVKGRIRKTFTLHKPDRMTRLLRHVF